MNRLYAKCKFISDMINFVGLQLKSRCSLREPLS